MWRNRDFGVITISGFWEARFSCRPTNEHGRYAADVPIMEEGERPSSPSRVARAEHAMLQDASATLASRQRRAEPTMEELMRMPLRSHQRWDGVRFFEPPR